MTWVFAPWYSNFAFSIGMALIKKYWLMIVAAGVLGAGVVAYTLLKPTDVVELVSSEPRDPVVTAQSAEILTLLNDLKKLSFDEALFSDPRFRSLVDFSVEIAPEPKGKRNPFLPLGAIDDGAAGTSTSEASPPPSGAAGAAGGVR